MANTYTKIYIHAVFAIKPTITVSDLMRVIKTNSSKFINERKVLPHRFEWQRGFGAFSFGYSQVDRVVRYIENQETHHRKRSFQEEYLEFLKDFEIEFKNEYLFDWITGNDR